MRGAQLLTPDLSGDSVSCVWRYHVKNVFVCAELLCSLSSKAFIVDRSSCMKKPKYFSSTQLTYHGVKWGMLARVSFFKQFMQLAGCVWGVSEAVRQIYACFDWSGMTPLKILSFTLKPLRLFQIEMKTISTTVVVNKIPLRLSRMAATVQNAVAQFFCFCRWLIL